MESIFARALGQEPVSSTAQEKRELLSRLIARLAHEIRNPLSSLHIHVQLLEEDVARSLPEAKSRFATRFNIIHGELTRKAIDDYIREEPDALPELAQGYERSITAWNQFWQNIFDACIERPAALS